MKYLTSNYHTEEMKERIDAMLSNGWAIYNMWEFAGDWYVTYISE